MSVPNLAYIERYIKEGVPKAAHWVILVSFSCPTIVRAHACPEVREYNDK